MLQFDPITVRICSQLLLAVILGMLVGLEREHRRKAAGLRTYTLVCLGAALFTILSVDGFSRFAFRESFDPARIAAQVVVGIGFIAGGLIILHDNKIQGLTTAAGLWTVSAIGMAVGLEFYTVAIFTTLLTLGIMWMLRRVEVNLPREEIEAAIQIEK
jgi:putative Mg2+ transporter-C (MgtC) family protein